ncbi:MAG: hypothetical protein ACJ797_14425 [Ktedonobacteraceae bacterium]
MAIAVATLANTPYEIAGPTPAQVYNAPPIFAYDWNAARVTTATGPSNPSLGRTKVTLTLNAGGDTIFLPFQADQVHSVYLPTAAIAAAGVTGFLTPNLSGCRIYIDKVVGTNELVIYHANALASGAYPGPYNPLNLDKETGIRTQALDTQYRNSKAYWTAATPTRAALNLTQVDGLGATTYYTSAVRAVQAGQNAGRTSVDFYGGTSVVGQLVAGAWQIWWQTYGDITYTGKTVGNLNMQVLASGQLRT